MIQTDTCSLPQPYFSNENELCFQYAQGNILYDDVPVNIGGGYSAATGSFTAPVGGTYLVYQSSGWSMDIFLRFSHEFKRASTICGDFFYVCSKVKNPIQNYCAVCG